MCGGGIMKIETKMYSVGRILWEGLLEYKESNISNGEIVIFPEEVKASILGLSTDSVDLVLSYLLFFKMSIKIDLKRLATNAWIDSELPEHKWNRFRKNLQKVLREYLEENNLLQEGNS